MLHEVDLCNHEEYLDEKLENIMDSIFNNTDLVLTKHSKEIVFTISNLRKCIKTYKDLLNYNDVAVETKEIILDDDACIVDDHIAQCYIFIKDLNSK